MKYDSSKDTLLHISRVAALAQGVCSRLILRAANHDASKLVFPEKEIFDEYTPKLKDTTYGSDEYNKYLTEMKEALDNHYAVNSHHPEHHKDGIDGMDLLDLVEMLCDWKAASERHEDGDIYKSILTNKERFGMSDQLVRILQNTIHRQM
ncbi:hypothetical protein KAR91_60825 [Candidatus Pacearchaeota archaeon]|nr:hypothetical protein [Candidatus Pacearchaeota archaeon]